MVAKRRTSRAISGAMAGIRDADEHYLCPLTQEVMRDPVIDPEGNSYERSAIVDWLSRNPTSPMTRTPLHAGQLAPNRVLKELIAAQIAEGKLPPFEGGDAEAPAALPRPVDAGSDAAPPLPSPARGGAGAGAAAGGAGGGVGPPPPEGVALSLSAERGDDEVLLLATALPPDHTARDPVDVCCVVDVSGSMCSAATMQSGEVDAEAHGLSLLDIVKHAVRTVVHSLKDTDKLSIVAYSDTATAVLRPTAMTSRGKALADSAMASLKPGGRTNLWDGLYTGMELLRKARAPGRTAAVLLLTDGCPNIEPPRGHMPMLRRYLDTHSELSATIHTFGFGYQLDSSLLDKLATEGHGAYSFIPDSSFVGTAFVHAVSNVLSTAARDVTLALEPAAGVTPAAGRPVLADIPCESTSWGLNIRLGNLQFGQRRDVVVRLRVPRDVDISTCVVATLRYVPAGAAEPSTCEAAAVSVVEGRAAAELRAQAARSLAVDAMHAALAAPSREQGLTQIQTIARSIRETVPGAQEVRSARGWDPLAAASGLRRGAAGEPNVRVGALLDDLQGQVAEAFSREDWFSRWGRHYVPSICRAHQLQLANNFKDPGVQFYGGSLFRKERDDADAIFVRLPPPEPSRARPRPSGSGGGPPGGRGGRGGSRARRGSAAGATPRRGAAAYAPPPTRVSMASFHNRSNPCFDGNARVALPDGATSRVADVKRGMEVATPGGTTARVLCVVRTSCMDGVQDLCKLPGGLLVTKYHPVRIDGAWKFPCDVVDAVERPCPAVYSFVLDVSSATGEPVMIIDGIEAATLGHGMSDPAGTTVPCLSHEFFGTERVVNALRELRGWDAGLVELQPGCCVRDPVTDLVVGFSPKK